MRATLADDQPYINKDSFVKTGWENVPPITEDMNVITTGPSTLVNQGVPIKEAIETTFGATETRPVVDHGDGTYSVVTGDKLLTYDSGGQFVSGSTVAPIGYPGDDSTNVLPNTSNLGVATPYDVRDAQGATRSWNDYENQDLLTPPASIKPEEMAPYQKMVLQ